MNSAASYPSRDSGRGAKQGPESGRKEVRQPKKSKDGNSKSGGGGKSGGNKSGSDKSGGNKSGSGKPGGSDG